MKVLIAILLVGPASASLAVVSPTGLPTCAIDPTVQNCLTTIAGAVADNVALAAYETARAAACAACTEGGCAGVGSLRVCTFGPTTLACSGALNTVNLLPNSPVVPLDVAGACAPYVPTTYSCAEVRATLACASTCTTAEKQTLLPLALPLFVDPAGSQFATLSACPVIEPPCIGTLVFGVCIPTVPEVPKADPCFPSDALVTMVDGTPRRLDALRAGDTIVAARADGSLTNDIVSHLSLADADVKGTSFVVLTTESGRNVTLTPTHHVPVGATCCANLKEAKDIVVGETVYEAVVSAAVRATQVKKIGTVTKSGLHSPVLSHGAMPIVNGVVTSFDTMEIVRLATYGLPLLEATGLTATFRDAVLAQRKYIRAHEGYIASVIA